MYILDYIIHNFYISENQLLVPVSCFSKICIREVCIRILKINKDFTILSTGESKEWHSSLVPAFLHEPYGRPYQLWLAGSF